MAQAKQEYVLPENPELDAAIAAYHKAGKTKETYFDVLELIFKAKLIVPHAKIKKEQHNKNQPIHKRKIKAAYADDGKVMLPVFTNEDQFSAFEYKYEAYAETNYKIIFSTARQHKMGYVLIYGGNRQVFVILPVLYEYLERGELPSI
jgi:hypothetical protein